MASLPIKAIDVGIVPKSGKDKLGLIGLPTWMWVKNPTAATWGPITRSASQGPVSVTLTARATDVYWDMGDGTTVTCGKGTPYKAYYGDKDSPNCGHRYKKTSADEPGDVYKVVATTHWEVTWSGMGQTGTFSLERKSDPVPIRVGEMQVIVE